MSNQWRLSKLDWLRWCFSVRFLCLVFVFFLLIHFRMFTFIWYISTFGAAVFFLVLLSIVLGLVAAVCELFLFLSIQHSSNEICPNQNNTTNRGLNSYYLTWSVVFGTHSLGILLFERTQQYCHQYVSELNNTEDCKASSLLFGTDRCFSSTDWCYYLRCCSSPKWTVIVCVLSPIRWDADIFFQFSIHL